MCWMRISEIFRNDCRRWHCLIPTILFAFVCILSSYSLFRNVNDWQIVGKWIGFAIAMGGTIIVFALSGIISPQSNSLLTENSLRTISIILSVDNVCVAVTCLLQFAGILDCASSFPMTSDFDNPAGVAALFCVTIPFSLTTFQSNRYRTLCFMSIVVLDLTVLLLSQSRSGIITLSLCVSSYLCCTVKSHLKRNIILSMFILLSAIFLIFLFRWKTGSTSGRMAIINVCFEMIREHPLFGYGPGGFLKYYMLYQADYLSNIKSDELLLLADNITHPLCEYLLIAVNYGIVGLSIVLFSIVLIIRFVVKRCVRYKLSVLMTLCSICILSFFSYPFRYPMTTVSLVVCLLFVIIGTFGHLFNSRLANISLLLFLGIAAYPFVSWYRAQTMWKTMTDKIDSDITFAKEAKRSIIPNTDHVLKENARYQYSRGAVNYYAGYLEESLDDLLSSSFAISSYDTELLLGKVYNELSISDSAVYHWNLASQMCPSRIKPKYFLFKLYEQSNDTIKMMNIGSDLLEMPVKIPSSDARLMRLEVRRILFKLQL